MKAAAWLFEVFLSIATMCSLLNRTTLAHQPTPSMRLLATGPRVPTPTPSIARPTTKPSKVPSSAPMISLSVHPSVKTSISPSNRPTMISSVDPSSFPSIIITSGPTVIASQVPSSQPSSKPTPEPTCPPTFSPSVLPSAAPTVRPSVEPTVQPTSSPSNSPTDQPSSQPSNGPSIQPLLYPSSQPTNDPSDAPTAGPSAVPTQPTTQPSCQPTATPSLEPSNQPSFLPSTQPSSRPTARPWVQPTFQPSGQPTSQPSHRPTGQPLRLPTTIPSVQPTRQPSCRPSLQPTADPSRQPISQPTCEPSRQPIFEPSHQPSGQPSIIPSADPSGQPFLEPTSQPTQQPTLFPTEQPSNRPIAYPTRQPSSLPTLQPSSQPSHQPSIIPSHLPSNQPTSRPSVVPTFCPSSQPSLMPTVEPSSQPSGRPSMQPTRHPSSQPSKQPTMRPSSNPSQQPTIFPTSCPSSQPTGHPSSQPATRPTALPSTVPSVQPTTHPSSTPTCNPSCRPTEQPHNNPSNEPSEQPSGRPSSQPTTTPSLQPSRQPNHNPSAQPSMRPTTQPSLHPSTQPSSQPSIIPSRRPTSYPTCQPQSSPSMQPSDNPSSQPVNIPSLSPTVQPTWEPSTQPASQPSMEPSMQPSSMPSTQPTLQPFRLPTRRPSAQPSMQPTREPSNQPLSNPSAQPTSQPSKEPTAHPSRQPSLYPSGQPSRCPSQHPSTQPSANPSTQPTLQPTVLPSHLPTCQPATLPTAQPSTHPSKQPSSQPCISPSAQPSASPSRQPTIYPSHQPSQKPTSGPSVQPSGQPSCQPTYEPTNPTSQPTDQPTSQPSVRPSLQPTCIPSLQPSTQPSSLPSRQPSCHPSSQYTRPPSTQPVDRPSTQPTTQPSSIPSIEPTREPSALPSAQPSVQPTAVPTSSTPTTLPTQPPTRYPIASGPGRTKEPSDNPSSSPSLDMDYNSHFTYRDYERSLEQYRSLNDSFTYSTYYFKGLFVEGDRPSWDSFYESHLFLPFDELRFSRLTLDMEAYNFDSHLQSNRLYVCDDSRVISNLLQSLREQQVYAADCNGFQWRVFQCSTGGWVDNIVCVGCKLSCALSETCPGKNTMLNPSAKCFSHTATYSVFHAEYESTRLYPQFDLPLVLTANRTSVLVSTSISASGNIYCAALKVDEVLRSVASIKTGGVRAIAQTTGAVDLLLKGLSPDMEYQVFCYSEDFSSHGMTLRDTASTRTPVRTACCPSVVLRSIVPLISAYTSDGSMPEADFSFSLDSPPPVEVIIRIGIDPISCTGSSPPSRSKSSPIAVPNQFMFSHRDASLLQGVFRIRSSQAACLQVRLEGKGYQSASFRVDVVSAKSWSPLPVATMAFISDAGTSIMVSFDSSTDRACSVVPSCDTSFACNVLLSFIGSPSSLCHWVNSSLLAATPMSADITPSIGQPIQLLPSKLKASCLNLPTYTCNGLKYVSATTLPLQPPMFPSVARAVLSSMSAVVSYCDDISLDPTQSSGHGGRQWSTVRWSVAVLGIATGADTIRHFLNHNYTNTHSVVTIPNSLLTRSHGGRSSFYVFGLNVVNYLGQASTSQVTIRVAADVEAVTPLIVLSSVADVVFSWQPISIYAAVQFPPCVRNATTALPIEYSWRMYDQSFRYLSAIRSVSLDRRYFKLDPYGLRASTKYYLLLSASTELGSQYATTAIIVGRSKIVARIIESPSKSGSYLETITIDASASQDLDDPTSSRLSYRWTCSVWSPDFGSSCSGFRPDNSSLLTIGPTDMIPGRTYTISVLVTSADGQYDRASTQLTIFASASPQIQVSNVPSRFNVGDKLILTTRIVASQGNCTAQWMSQSDASTDLTSFALSPLLKQLAKGVNIFQISLSTDGLQGGVGYGLSIRAYYTSGSYSSSSVQVVVNRPPTGGAIEVSPLTGHALQSMFTVTTYLWTDDASDLPLRYILSYYTVRSSDCTTIKALDAIPYVLSMMGQGLSSKDYAVQCIAAAVDAYGGTASQSTTVQILPPSPGYSLVPSAISILQLASIQKDPILVSQTSAAVLSSLNSMDCSNVPVSCPGVNREACSDAPNTCGPCLPGFTGPTDTGASNLPCARTELALTEGSACRSTDLCLKGACVNGTCAVASKTCPGDCNDRGMCLFFDTLGGEVSSCLLTDDTCQARCVCNDAFFGKYCTLSSEAYVQYGSLRQHLCRSIYESMHFQDVSPDAIRSRALQVADILLDIEQVSDEAISECTSALLQTVRDASAASCHGDSFGVVLRALSNVLDRGSALSQSSLDAVSQAITILLRGCQENMGIGESPAIAVTTNIRSIVAVLDSGHGTITPELRVPLTAWEKMRNATASWVRLSGDLWTAEGDQSLSVGMSVFKYDNNPHKLSLNISSVRVDTTVYGGHTRRLLGSAGTIETTLHLVNAVASNFDEMDVSSAMVPCFRNYQLEEYQVSFTCPSNAKSLTFTCPSNAKGYHHVTCPGYQIVPQCTVWDREHFSIDDQCTVVSATAYDVTCYCRSTSTNSSRRALQSTTTSYSAEYSSTSVKVWTDVQSNFIEAPRSSAVEGNSVIDSFLYSIVGVTVVGLIFFGRWDATATSPSGSYSDRYQKMLRLDDEQSFSIGRGIGEFFESLYPDALRPVSEWYAVLYGRLCVEHSLYKLCAVAHHGVLVSSRIVSWMDLIVDIIALTFISTVIVYLLFADDGRCEAILNRSSCSKAGPASWQSTGWRACSWRSDNETCVFQPPDVSFPSVIVLALIVAMVSCPIRRVVHRMALYAYLQWNLRVHISNKMVIPSLPVQKFGYIGDEFAEAASKQSTWLRAARLVKLQDSMDLVSPAEEAVGIRHHLSRRSPYDRNGSHEGLSSGFSLDGDTFLSKVNYSRSESIKLRALYEAHPAAMREKLLMQHFIINHFSGYKNRVIESYFFGANNHRLLLEFINKDSKYSKCCRYGSCVGWPVLLAIMLSTIILMRASIGSRSTDLWLLIVLVTIVIDIAAIQALAIWANWLVTYYSVVTDFESIMVNLKGKSRTILRRTAGVMRHCDGLVQHLNPACRVARMFPAYPVCRLLFSINDGDIADPGRTRWDAVGCFIGWTIYLPQPLCDIAIDCLALLLFDGALLAVFYFGQFSVVAVCLVLGLLFSIAVGWILWLEREYARVRSVKQSSYNSKVFRQVDEEDELTIRAIKARESTISVGMPVLRDPIDCDDAVVLSKKLGSLIGEHGQKQPNIENRALQTAPSSVVAPSQPADARPLATIYIPPASHQSSVTFTDGVADKASVTSFLYREGYPRPKVMSGPPLSSQIDRVFGPAVDASAFDLPEDAPTFHLPHAMMSPDLQQYVSAERDFTSTFGRIWNPIDQLMDFRSKSPVAGHHVDEVVVKPDARRRHRNNRRRRTVLPAVDQGDYTTASSDRSVVPVGPGASLLQWKEEERTNTSMQLLQNKSEPASAVDLYDRRTVIDLQNYSRFLSHAKKSRGFGRFDATSPDIDFALIAGSSAAERISAETTQLALTSSGYRSRNGARVRRRSGGGPYALEEENERSVGKGPGGGK